MSLIVKDEKEFTRRCRKLKNIFLINLNPTVLSTNSNWGAIENDELYNRSYDSEKRDWERQGYTVINKETNMKVVGYNGYICVRVYKLSTKERYEILNPASYQIMNLEYEFSKKKPVIENLERQIEELINLRIIICQRSNLKQSLEYDFDISDKEFQNFKYLKSLISKKYVNVDIETIRKIDLAYNSLSKNLKYLLDKPVIKRIRQNIRDRKKISIYDKQISETYNRIKRSYDISHNYAYAREDGYDEPYVCDGDVEELIYKLKIRKVVLLQYMQDLKLVLGKEEKEIQNLECIYRLFIETCIKDGIVVDAK